MRRKKIQVVSEINKFGSRVCTEQRGVSELKLEAAECKMLEAITWDEVAEQGCQWLQMWLKR